MLKQETYSPFYYGLLVTVIAICLCSCVIRPMHRSYGTCDSQSFKFEKFYKNGVKYLYASVEYYCPPNVEVMGTCALLAGEDSVARGFVPDEIVIHKADSIVASYLGSSGVRISNYKVRQYVGSVRGDRDSVMVVNYYMNDDLMYDCHFRVCSGCGDQFGYIFIVKKVNSAYEVDTYSPKDWFE